MRTNCYIDGLNLYKRCLQRTPYKWLDVPRLLELEFPANDIERVRYFTALVRGHFERAGESSRQRTYLAALKSLPKVSLHFGVIRSDPAFFRPMWPKEIGADFVEVWDEHEKGSDVNLATWLMADLAGPDAPDAAIVVTRDSDQVECVRLARQVFGKPVGVLDPGSERSKALFRAASFYRNVHPTNLAAAQLPSPITTLSGRRIVKPSDW